MRAEACSRRVRRHCRGSECSSCSGRGGEGASRHARYSTDDRAGSGDPDWCARALAIDLLLQRVERHDPDTGTDSRDHPESTQPGISWRGRRWPERVWHPRLSDLRARKQLRESVGLSLLFGPGNCARAKPVSPHSSRNAKGALSWAPFVALDLVSPSDCGESPDSALGSAATTGEGAAVAVAGHARPEGVHQIGDGRRAVAAGGLVDLVLDPVLTWPQFWTRPARSPGLPGRATPRGFVPRTSRSSSRAGRYPVQRRSASAFPVAGRLTGERRTRANGRNDNCAEHSQEQKRLAHHFPPRCDGLSASSRTRTVQPSRQAYATARPGCRTAGGCWANAPRARSYGSNR